MKSFILTAIACVAVLSGCAESKDSAKDQNYVVNRGESGGSRQPASALDYKRIHYTTDGSCAAGNIYFRFLSVENVNLGKNAIGNDILADADVLIHSDGRYEVEYLEKYITDYTATGYRYKRQRVRNFEGNWKDVNGKLVLDDLMEISAQELDRKVVAEVHYKKDIVTAGLKGAIAKGVNVWSTAGIRSYREVCATDQDTLGAFETFRSRDSRTSIALKGLVSSDRLVAGEVAISGMELLIHPDGRYHLIARAKTSVDSFSVERPYIIESGTWERFGSQLKLYYSVVNLVYGSNGVELKFTRDPMLFDDEHNKGYMLALTGKSVRMKMAPSSLNMDDLTDTYR
ncbi:MAG: hypothetical protein AB7G93_04685 [Bdellovibrionales bacterium]